MPNRRTPQRTPREEWKCRVFDARAPLYARVIGIPYHTRLEVADDPDRVDHVWFTVQIPPCGPILISVNTLSRFNLLAGFDARIRVAILRTRYAEKPEPLIEEHTGLDYAIIEAQFPLTYEHYEHATLAQLLIEKGHAALRIEAWGELYRQGHLGLHQIHSRRASCAVKTDIIGHDGAIRFYLPGGDAEMFLFKYCGQ